MDGSICWFFFFFSWEVSFREVIMNSGVRLIFFRFEGEGF